MGLNLAPSESGNQEGFGPLIQLLSHFGSVLEEYFSPLEQQNHLDRLLREFGPKFWEYVVHRKVTIFQLAKEECSVDYLMAVWAIHYQDNLKSTTAAQPRSHRGPWDFLLLQQGDKLEQWLTLTKSLCFIVTCPSSGMSLQMLTSIFLQQTLGETEFIYLFRESHLKQLSFFSCGNFALFFTSTKEIPCT